jgi:acyl-CoA thioester hydrolase
MPSLFTLPLSVPAAAIDENGHVNNVVYVQWMQDVASAHADQAGYGVARCQQLGGTWVVRSHSIDYLGAALLGDRLRLETWLAELGRSSCRRRYRFVREADGRVLARAGSHYVYINGRTLRPQALPAPLLQAMRLHGDESAD